MQLEHEVEKQKNRYKDILMKKASGIMRDEFNELERKYNNCREQLEKYQRNHDEIATKVDTVKTKMRKRHDEVLKALEDEKSILQHQVDSYKMLTAELKTENRDVKSSMAEMQKKVD